jgi:hypothetical protein
MTELIRLACVNCDRDDCDGITMEKAAADGWQEITEFQDPSLAETVFDNPDDAPEGFDALAWWTHLGICPDCHAED